MAAPSAGSSCVEATAAAVACRLSRPSNVIRLTFRAEPSTTTVFFLVVKPVKPLSSTGCRRRPLAGSVTKATRLAELQRSRRRRLSMWREVLEFGKDYPYLIWLFVGLSSVETCLPIPLFLFSILLHLPSSALSSASLSALRLFPT